jgi:hypothetical protein
MKLTEFEIGQRVVFCYFSSLDHTYTETVSVVVRMEEVGWVGVREDGHAPSKWYYPTSATLSDMQLLGSTGHMHARAAEMARGRRHLQGLLQRIPLDLERLDLQDT